MKKKTTLIIAGTTLFLAMLAGPLTAGRQSIGMQPVPTTESDSVLVEWQFLTETTTLFDIFYRIVRCNGQNVVELKLLNENPREQIVSFDITVTGTGETILVQQSYTGTFSGNQFIEANCKEGREPDKMFVIPGNEDPTSLKVNAILRNN